MKKIILFITLLSYLFGATAQASPDSNMNTFWNDSLASSNAIGPSAYQGQEAGYYTLGNLSTRAPIKNVQVVGVAMPSVKGGCGGIDMFGGSFSFINSDQLIALFKATAQNAVGLLFQMAVKTLSELLGNEVETLVGWVNQANRAELNSCTMAQTLINSAVDNLPGSTLKNCISLGLANHTYTDTASARAACGFGGNAESTVNGATGDDAKTMPTNRNVAWEAISANSVFSSDANMAQLMMTLTGTISIYVDSSTNKVTVDAVPAEGDKDAMINALLDGNTAIPVHRCGELSKCLNYTKFGMTVAVTGLKPKVDALIDDIVNKIRTKQTLTTEETNLMGLSTIPLYKIASVQVAANGALASSQMKQFSESIATDVLLGWLKQNLDQVQQASIQIQGVDPTALATWNGGLRDIADRLDKRAEQNRQTFMAVTALIDRTHVMEQEIATNTTSRLAQSLMFVNAKRPG